MDCFKMECADVVNMSTFKKNTGTVMTHVSQHGRLH
jgi:hypothetical protein